MSRPWGWGPRPGRHNFIAAAEVAIAREASEIRQGGIPVDTHVALGSASGAILEAAAERRRRAHRGGDARPQGRRAPVPGQHRRDRGAIIHLSRAGGPGCAGGDRALAGTDAVAADRRDGWHARRRGGVFVAGSFARGHACELSAVRVFWPAEEAMRYGLDDPWVGPLRDPELLPLLRRDLQHDARALIGASPRNCDSERRAPRHPRCLPRRRSRWAPTR